MPIYAGIDVGTSGLKAIAVGDDGRILGEKTVAYKPSTPRPGWSEQPAEDWSSAAAAACQSMCDDGLQPDAIGLSGQMHGSVFLGSNDQPLAPAILWNDQRTVAECDEIERRTAGNIRKWTLNSPRTAFTASKILWLRNNLPDKFSSTTGVVLPKDFVRLAMTGERATDVTDASGTNLLDVAARSWSLQALDALEIPRDWMPKIHESSDVTGKTSSAFARQSGLRTGIPVVGGAADQAAAAVGNGIVSPGAVSITIGTSGVVYAQTDGIRSDPTESFHSFCHAVPGSWQVMATVLSAAGSFQWFRETIGKADADAAESAGGSGFDALFAGISAVPAGASGLLFLPYLTGERSPHNDPLARGAFIGLTHRHGREHMARATIEGICFALRDLVEGLSGFGVTIDEVRIAGGAARNQNWLRILASVLGRPVRATATPDASAYGAAILAMAGHQQASIADIARNWVVPSVPIAPDPAAASIYAEMYGLYRSCYPATRDAMHGLNRIDELTAV